MKLVEQDLPTGFVGRSPRIVQLRGQIEKLGVRRSPVLIQGESGTGKEVAARSLYNAAPRGQFVPIDCGSLVGTMMESELFGHVRGAFTGAVDAKRGLIELANGGTAFFDEIGELPLELQVKLLRVLQEQELRPLGSLQRIKIDVRLVAATNRDLQKEVAAGRFREDLFHRLNVVRLTLPPLRERKEDIPLLIERFLSLANGRFILSHEAIEAIMDYDWPGNIRELMNCLERMMSFNSGPLLHFADLPSGLLNFTRAQTMSRSSSPPLATGARPGRLRAATPTPHGVVPLQELEKRAIQHALQHTQGDRTIAAQLLGIGRTTLYRKLKEYQLESSWSNRLSRTFLTADRTRCHLQSRRRPLRRWRLLARNPERPRRNRFRRRLGLVLSLATLLARAPPSSTSERQAPLSRGFMGQPFGRDFSTASISGLPKRRFRRQSRDFPRSLRPLRRLQHAGVSRTIRHSGQRSRGRRGL